MPDPIQQIFHAAREGRALEAHEALALAAAPSEAFAAAVTAAAARPANSFPPRFSCGIINAKSGRCGEDCAFCAQSRYHTTGTPVYPLLSAEALYDRAHCLAERGVTRMGIVTSGAGPSAAELDKICAAAQHIREKVGIGLCASLGVLDAGMAEQLKQAGFGSYHHNLETARSFYSSICTTHSYEIRCETVRQAKEAGLRVCSGGLFGLGESWAQRIELAATLRELDVDSIPINFLMPVAGTRLASAPPLAAADALAIVALFRLMHPGRDIVLCGGRGATLGERDRLALLGGANGVMVGDYLTAKGSPFERDMDLLRELETCRA